MKSDNVQVIGLAPSLINAGYQVVPVSSGNEPVPLIKNFSAKQFTIEDANSWGSKFVDANLALCTERNNVYALDFDVDTAKLSNRLIKLVKGKWKNIPIRYCNNPRFAILFRADEDLVDLSNGYSNGYKKGGVGTINQIELIGYNKTITIYGQHRSTNNHYRWNTKTRKLRTKAEHLPVLCKADIEEIFAVFAKYKPEGWDKVITQSLSFKGPPKSEDAFENAKIKKVYDEKRIDEIIAAQPCNNRREWLDVGMALKYHYGDTKESLIEGLRKWDEWSQLDSENYVSYEDCAEQYRSFDNDKPNVITMESLERRMIRKKNLTNSLEKELDLSTMLEDYVWITKGKRIGKLTGPSEQAVCTAEEIKAHLINRRVKVNKRNKKTGENSEEYLPVFDLWRQSEPSLRKEAFDTLYVPGKARLIYPELYDKEGKSAYFNVYHEPNVKMTDNKDLLHHFIDHMKYIFNENYDLAMTWFAQIVQEPWQRYRTALHSICLHQGTGRGWLNDLFNEIVGQKNVSHPSINEVMGDRNFDEFMDDKVLAIVSEASVRGEDRYRLSDSLKTFLGDDHHRVNLKYGEMKASKEIYTRLFTQANDIGDLYIEDEDTRMIVCINYEPRKPNSYYIKLRSLLNRKLNPDFHDQVYTYLMNWKVDINLLIDAPFTKHKQIVVEAVKSPTALAFYKLKTLIGKNIISEHMLLDFVSHFVAVASNADSDMDSIVNTKELNRLRKDQLRVTDVVNVDGKKIKINSFHDHNLDRVNKNTIKRSIITSKKLIDNSFLKLETSKEK